MSYSLFSSNCPENTKVQQNFACCWILLSVLVIGNSLEENIPIAEIPIFIYPIMRKLFPMIQTATTTVKRPNDPHDQVKTMCIVQSKYYERYLQFT